eukprot:GHRQ01029546.1.p2 GENE.GHRQ01029546.1~~GHRQ01029546.1.p2  ORF type:complete len:156 (+),score=34.25 GHRQ01029546.1:240-707(+)
MMVKPSPYTSVTALSVLITCTGLPVSSLIAFKWQGILMLIAPPLERFACKALTAAPLSWVTSAAFAADSAEEITAATSLADMGWYAAQSSPAAAAVQSPPDVQPNAAAALMLMLLSALQPLTPLSASVASAPASLLDWRAADTFLLRRLHTLVRM